MERGAATAWRHAAAAALLCAVWGTGRAMHDTFYGDSIGASVVILESPVGSQQARTSQPPTSAA